MAQLIGHVNSDYGRTVTHRVASQHLHTQAATWHTFVNTYLEPDGSGWAEVIQNGQSIKRMEWTAESGK